MNYTRIQARVTDQAIQLVNVPLIASGGLNEVRVDFTFCPKWNGKAKTAVFYRDPEQAYHVLLIGDSAVVPAEVLETDGLFYFGVFGTGEDQVRTTEVVSMTIVKGAITFKHIDPVEPTPDIYHQILSAYGKMEAALAVERARIDTFFATKGGTGSITETPIEADGLVGTAYSNGAHVFISLRFSDLPMAANSEQKYACIPAELAPLGLLTFESLPNNQLLTVHITPRRETGTEYAELIITNPGEDEVTDSVEFEINYPLEQLTLPEVTDLRVGPSGKVYPTAGQAVRAHRNPCWVDSGNPNNLADYTQLEDIEIGMLYMDEDNGDLYKCTAEDDGVYIWEKVGGGSGTVDLSNYYTKEEINQTIVNLGLDDIPTKAYIWDEASRAAEYVVQREIGNISTALDNIIALQEELIGPTPEPEPEVLITFTIRSHTYAAVSGMTWREWVASEYNTADIRIADNGTYLYEDGDESMYLADDDNYNVMLHPDDEILDGHEYGIY